MILPVLQYPDPRLARVSLPIQEVTPEMRELAENMVETMYARDGIGLAAPQVGTAIRLVVLDVSGPDRREDLHILINPVLTITGPEIESEEGCLSIADYRSTVCRSRRVHVKATDLDGNPVSFDAEDLLAICIQHECDHLDGILFLDHISRLKRSMFDRKIKKRASK